MTHIHEIQTALDYIEMNLHEELNLDNVSSIVGFSKFYFNRIFNREVGISLYAYIRKRRLTKAALLLRTTDVSILNIALTYQFESQEAFTRAFKSVYQLPPGRYRTTIKDIVIGGVEVSDKSKIKGWILTGTVPDEYQMSLDNNVFHMGSKAATIKYIADKPYAEGYGTIMQQISTKNYVGKRMRFSGFIKTEGVKGWCGLWMRIDNSLGTTLKLDNMQNRAINGTTEWNYYSCVLDIPNDGAIINIGVLLAGEGQIWFDNVDFQEVDHNTPTTDFTPEVIYSDILLNPSFEE